MTAVQELANRCWVLSSGSPEPEDEPHYRTEQAARDAAANYARFRRPPSVSQLAVPCVVISCPNCDETYDGEDGGTVHWEPDEAGTFLADPTQWGWWRLGDRVLCTECMCTEAGHDWRPWEPGWSAWRAKEHEVDGPGEHRRCFRCWHEEERPVVESPVTVTRTAVGWRVTGAGGEDLDDLTSAMVLADLIAGPTTPGGAAAARRPIGDDGDLATAVRQMEYALRSRVVIEQAIGVLAERFGIGPRDAFERLRRDARSHGERVHDLARRVVADAAGAPAPLPPALARPTRLPGLVKA